MKNVIKFLTPIALLLSMGWIFGYQPDEKTINKDQAWNIVKKDILKEKLENKFIFAKNSLLNAGQEIKSWGSSLKTPDSFQHAWLFFVDDQPDANWGHDCRYIFVDSQSGKTHIIKSASPPDSLDDMTQIYPPLPKE